MSVSDIISLLIRTDPGIRERFPAVGEHATLSFLNGISMSCWHLIIPCITYALIDASMKKITTSQLKRMLEKEAKENPEENEAIEEFGFTVLITSTLTNDALARKRRRLRERQRGDHLSLIDAPARYTCLLQLDKKIFH